MTFIEQNTDPANPDDQVRKVKVKIDNRSFTVAMASDGSPLRVTERRVYAPDTAYSCFYNAPYWHAQHHKQPKRQNSLIARIFAAAAESNEAVS